MTKPSFTKSGLPRYVRVGSANGTALRLTKDHFSGKDVYYRDAGMWETEFKIIDKTTLIAWYPGMGFHKKELIPITREEYRKDNAGYV